jgi:hypothetical protein
VHSACASAKHAWASALPLDELALLEAPPEPEELEALVVFEPPVPDELDPDELEELELAPPVPDELDPDELDPEELDPEELEELELVPAPLLELDDPKLEHATGLSFASQHCPLVISQSAAALAASKPGL